MATKAEPHSVTVTSAAASAATSARAVAERSRMVGLGLRDLEHRPADLRAVPGLLGRVERADKIVLADWPLHADRPLRDRCTERAEGLIEVLEGPTVQSDGVLGRREQPHPDPAGRRGRPGDRDERHQLAMLVLQQRTPEK